MGSSDSVSSKSPRKPATTPSKRRVGNKPAAAAKGNGATSPAGATSDRAGVAGNKGVTPTYAQRHDREAIRRAFETGDYPYTRKIRRKTYEAHKRDLQVELLKVQDWAKETGQRIVLLFEGRDAAGK
ncbi:MAG: polyphosphate kinase 2, partial [Alphaproteobacteria bacterium]